MGPSKEQKQAMKRQKMEEQRTTQQRVKTTQQDLQQQTLELFRRYGTGGSPIKGM